MSEADYPNIGKLVHGLDWVLGMVFFLIKVGFWLLVVIVVVLLII